MNVRELMPHIEARALTGETGLDNPVSAGYACDLLSWVMAHGREHMAWVTVQTHMNVIAVATLHEMSCVIIPEGIRVEDAVAAKAAEEAGADYVGAEELVAKIQGENWFDFDVVVATPNMMGVVGRLGRVLGPKGLMPNPKSGTVTMDVAKAISEIKAGKVEYRLDKQAIIHCPIGKKSFTAEQLTANLTALMNAINRAKPAAAKGIYLRSVVLSSTMGPGIKVNPLKF